MKPYRFQYVFGPVSSWRLGRSLGIDPLSGIRKECNFNCIYCQLGETKKLRNRREVFAPTAKILKEISSFPNKNVDYYTFSSNGEPTLARNLGEIIAGIKKQKRGPVAVITNAGLIHRKDVQKDLLSADLVMAKLDACSTNMFSLVNRPHQEIELLHVIKGLKAFRKIFKGTLALQIMFVKENKSFAVELAQMAKDINPDEIQINTPLRPCAVKPLTVQEIAEIKIKFNGLNVFCVYDGKKEKVEPFNKKDTAKRHGIVQ